MPTGLNAYFAFPEKGGMLRDPKRIHSHKMLGKTNEAFMQNAVSMTATAQIKDRQVSVDVNVVNDQNGSFRPH